MLREESYIAIYLSFFALEIDDSVFNTVNSFNQIDVSML